VIIILFVLTLACGAWVLSLEGKEASLVATGWNAAPDSVRLAAQNAYFCCGLSTFNVTAVQPCPSSGTPPVFTTVACSDGIVVDIQKYYSAFGGIMLTVCITLLGDVGLTWWLFKVLNRLKARA